MNSAIRTLGSVPLDPGPFAAAGLVTPAGLAELTRVETAIRADGGVVGCLVAEDTHGAPTALAPLFVPYHGAGDTVLFIGHCGRRGTSRTNALAATDPAQARLLLAAAAGFARARGCVALCLPLLNDAQRDLLAEAGVPSRAVAEQSGSAVIETAAGDLDGFIATLSHDHRRMVRRERRRFLESGAQVVERPAACAVELWPLLAAVEAKYGHTNDGAVYRGYLESAAAAMGPGGRALIGYDGSLPIAFSLRWDLGDRSRMRCWGADLTHPVVRAHFAYFNVAIYEPLARTLAAGQRMLELGAGSWDAKRRRGATLQQRTTLRWALEE